MEHRLARAGSTVIAAIALLTRLPVRTGSTRSGAAAFGLVGAALGIAAATPVLILAPTLGAVLSLAVLAIATGVLHLDGLSDTADALAAPTPDAAERARKDPRAGAAGVVSVVLILAIDAAAIADLAAGAPALTAASVVVAATAVSRAAAAAAPMVVRGTARPGFGSWFTARTRPLDAVVAVATAFASASVAAAVAGDVAVLSIALAGVVGGVLAARAVGALRRGLDGDGIGAVVELTFAATLVVAAVAL